MKKTVQFWAFALICILIFLLFSSLECNESSKEVQPIPEEPEECGPKDKSKQRIWAEGYYSIIPQDHFSTTDNGWAFYSFSIPTIENVCALKHVRVGFDISYDPSHGDDILYEAEVMYGVLYTYPAVTQWNAMPSSTIPGYVTSWWWAEFGMKFLYGEDPGWMFPIMTIMIRDQGTIEANHHFFSENIKWISISPEYYKWKDNSGGIK